MADVRKATVTSSQSGVGKADGDSVRVPFGEVLGETVRESVGAVAYI